MFLGDNIWLGIKATLFFLRVHLPKDYWEMLTQIHNCTNIFLKLWCP